MSLRSLYRFCRSIFELNYTFLISYLRKRRNALAVCRTTSFISKPPVSEVLNQPYLFVLSTGRCGTALITKILASSSSIRCEHNPKPDLEYVSSFVHHNNIDSQSLKAAVLASRFDLYFLDSYQRGQIYAETNNRISFFASALSELLPKSKFIHLVRDPADFVRSGMRRGYYQEGSVQYQRLNGSNFLAWNKFSPLEKITWEWNEINQNIENFKYLVPSHRVLTIFSESLYTDPGVTHDIYDFIGIDNPFSGIKGSNILHRILSFPINKQTIGDFPEYSRWSSADKKSFLRIATLAKLYGYSYD